MCLSNEMSGRYAHGQDIMIRAFGMEKRKKGRWRD